MAFFIFLSIKQDKRTRIVNSLLRIGDCEGGVLSKQWLNSPVKCRINLFITVIMRLSGKQYIYSENCLC
jgi:hypothetical protein